MAGLSPALPRQAEAPPLRRDEGGALRVLQAKGPGVSRAELLVRREAKEQENAPAGE